MNIENVITNLKENIHILEWDINIIQDSGYRQTKIRELNDFRRQLIALTVGQKEVENEA